ncbi:potassium channel family protein [Seohaeicola saemankumensis]|nr:potassium channel family protein [Seohaeicola saemankumensis]MCA0869692.1 potassium channel family protein [Seohaeicola saemankumensis]
MMAQSFKSRVNQLYTGHQRYAVRFRYALILFDAVTILFFIAVAAVPHGPWLTGISVSVGALIGVDFLARLWIAPDRRFMLTRAYTVADIVVVVSLLLDPFLHGSLAFLRILRGLRLIHSYHLMRDLRRESAWFRRHEDAVLAGVNLFVFVFLTASVVHAFFFPPGSSETPYVDALYFTVATLTTTGFGDITMSGPAGKLFSVFVMVVGVALFVQLARAIFQPQKVRYKCKECGLLRHDLDAVHCKHCGTRLKIETPGIE